MSIEGTSRLTRVQLAQLTLDFTKTTPEIRTLMAIIDPATGAAAFMRHNGSVWSAETQVTLRQLIECLERDVARVVLIEGGDSATERTAPTRKEPVQGLGEYLSGTDIPDM